MNTIQTFGLLTDFGLDFAVASMKALLLKSIPHAQIVDIDHSIDKFSITSGSFIIDKVHHYFPQGTIFICIVDPGVGSKREALCIEAGGYVFFGPNNGLYHHIVRNYPDHKIYVIDETIIKPASCTFHGRDLFVLAAAEYVQHKKNWLIPLDDAKRFINLLSEHCIAYIDSFGNIKTTISVDDSFISRSIISININGQVYPIQFVKTFSDNKEGELLCYKGSNETLEIAVNLGSAQQYLGAKVGDIVQIKR